MTKRIGRNDPCPCKSGRKYKKCCLPKGIPVSSSISVPVPTDVRTWGERIAEAARRAGPQQGMLVPSSLFQGYRFRGVRSTVYWNRPDQTFHEFMLEHLKLTLGKAWYFGELDRPAAERHQIIQWFDAAVEHNKKAIGDGPTGSGRVYEATATGDTWALLNLAYDVLQLRHRGDLPREVLDRLRSREGFQGARFEIATAATFVRAGFEIKFVEDPSGKHREFDAVDRGTGLVIGVESKSRHRPGLLGYPGALDEAAAARGDIEPLVREALDQDPGDRPFVICVDVNSPPRPGVPVQERAWYHDVESIVGSLPMPIAERPEQFTALVVTNWSFHWDGAKPANPGEWAIIASPYARHRLPEEVLGRIRAAFASYGDIPPDL